MSKIEPFAGRDLDRAVAEKMGYTVEIVGSIYVILDEENNRRPLRPYSISISSAWKVVNFAREKGFHFFLQKLTHDEEWTAEFCKNHSLWTVGDTAPHAICLGFLALKLD